MPLSVSATEARRDFTELLNKAGYGGEVVLIERHQRPVAALVPVSLLVKMGILPPEDTPAEDDSSSSR